MTYKRIGRDFDPSLGFVPRRATHLIDGRGNDRTRIARGPFQQLFHPFQPFVATDLSGKWESYRIFVAAVNWRFRSGDRFEINVNPTGEGLVEAFEVANGVTVEPGSYHWRRYRLEAGTAQKRRLYTQVTWWFGDFYNGKLDQLKWTGTWNPTPLLTVEFSGERNIGDLAAGRFRQTWSAPECASTSRRLFHWPPTPSTTRTVIPSAAIRASGGPSNPSATCSLCTTTTYGRCSSDGNSIRISC